MISKEPGMDDLLSVSEIAEMLHVSYKTINRLIGYGHGVLPAVMVGSRWKVRARDLKAYLQRQGGTFSDDQTFETILSISMQDTNTNNDILQLDVQKKYLELMATALEVATRMISSLCPDVDVTKKAALIRAIIFDLLEARNIGELEQAILKISPTDAEQEQRIPFWKETL